MTGEIEHSKDPTSFDDRCVQWQDNAGCSSWPCEVEAVRIKLRTGTRQRVALAAALITLVQKVHYTTEGFNEAFAALEAHVPGWRQNADAEDACAPRWRSEK